MKQDFDLHPVAGAVSATPLVVYAHPSQRTKWMPQSDPLYDRVIGQAHAAGFAVASVEYRHPVDDDFIVPAPHDDLAQATRWLRSHAAQLNIDPRNIFFLGHSRGTLLLWTAMHYTTDAQVRPNAIFMYNAQATYQFQETADLYIIEPDRAAFVAEQQALHPQYPLFGSALDDVGKGDAPLMLRYEQTFYRTQVPADLVDKHFPDAGLELCDAYRRLNGKKECSAVDGISGDHAYDGFAAFFSKYVVG